MTRKLSILTWNVWFDQLRRNYRYDEILDICNKLKPDVICFQEVTPTFIKILNGHLLLDNYLSSGTNWGTSSFPYGVISLCRKELNPTFTFTSMPTEMDRNLLITKFSDSNGNDVCIGNVHLESLDNPDLRAMQLKISEETLAAFRFSVLCGDFNICSYGNYSEDPRKPLENNSIVEKLPDYSDMWVTCKQPSGPEEANMGYTFDTVKNEMLAANNRYERWRYDRIMYCTRPESSSSPVWTPSSIRIVGDLPVGQNLAALSAPECDAPAQIAEPPPAEDTIFSTPVKKSRTEPAPVFPSDHFGLFGVFELLP